MKGLTVEELSFEDSTIFPMMAVLFSDRSFLRYQPIHRKTSSIIIHEVEFIKATLAKVGINYGI